MALQIDESRTALRFTNGAAAGRGAPKYIFIHHWGVDGQSHDGILEWFCSNAGVQTSAHFVASAGRVNCIVSTADVSWHCGDWDYNLVSIGIECRPEATEADYQTIAELIKFLRDMYGDLPLRPHNIQRTGTDGGTGTAWTDCPGRYDLNKLDRMARGVVTSPQASDVEPIPTTEEGFLMSLSDGDQKEILLNVRNTRLTQVAQGKELTASLVRLQQLQVQLEEVVVNARKVVYGIGDLKAGLAKLSAQDIASAIPKDLAEQVIKALSEKLAE